MFHKQNVEMEIILTSTLHTLEISGSNKVVFLEIFLNNTPLDIAKCQNVGHIDLPVTKCQNGGH